MMKKQSSCLELLFNTHRGGIHSALGALLSTLSDLAEVLLAYRTERAFKIVGKILEFSSGSDAVLGITERLVIFPAANVAYVFFHNNYSFLV